MFAISEFKSPSQIDEQIQVLTVSGKGYRVLTAFRMVLSFTVHPETWVGS